MTTNGGEIPGRRAFGMRRRVFVLSVIWRRGLALGPLGFFSHTIYSYSCVLYIDLGSLYIQQRTIFSDCIYITLDKTRTIQLFPHLITSHTKCDCLGKESPDRPPPKQKH